VLANRDALVWSRRDFVQGSLGALLAAVAADSTPAAEGQLPPHPRLLLDRAGLERLKGLLVRQAWARQAWAAIQRSADSALAQEVDLPPRGGAYYHFYIDPVHGSPLSRGKQVGKWQWEHRASADGKIYLGDPKNPRRDYDGYAILEIHQQWTRRVRDLGLAYRVTGDKKYAAQGKAILLAYAELYPTLPRRNHWGFPFPNSGRIATHMLSEAVWLIPAVQGADLIWDTLTAEERDTIADKVLRPCVRDILLPQDTGAHNRQCWKNTAVGLVGLLLDDRKLLAEALDKPKYGHRALLTEAVPDSGMWHEGSWSYHSYVLSALEPLTEAARHCGIDLYDQRFKALVDAPFRLAAPNGALPAFNDSSEGNVASFAAAAELAFARYREPLHLAVIDPQRRIGEAALFHGVEELPAAQPRAQRSVNFPGSGHAILTRGTGRESPWLCLKYGPHGGAHGHPDKASFVLYVRGQRLALDPGMALYGAPIHAGWYRTTLAHNTLTVDERSQHPTTGQALAFGSDQDAEFAVLDAGAIADGVRFVRSVALLDTRTVVFIDQVTADAEHTFDLAYHQVGRWLHLPAGSALQPPDLDGYRYLTEATTRTTDQGLTLQLETAPGWEPGVVLASGAATTVWTALGVGTNLKERVPVVVFRRQAKQTAYVWGLALDGQALRLQTLPATDGAGQALAGVAALGVHVTSGTSQWTVAVNRTGQTVLLRGPNGVAGKVAGLFAVQRP